MDMVGASDPEIWERACREDAIIVSKDEDFATLRTIQETGPSVIWLRMPNCRKQALLNGFASLWPQILERLSQGECLIELRG
ncbi:MAG: DUF5615 family PIN-like protein [Nitrospirae bacterium]|nr:DUF5615 family PIN-like protein [Nitrospirota bacterium]MCL5284912.1 DUF5615 family PIN-like protein [Nitrospirota bacterium]